MKINSCVKSGWFFAWLCGVLATVLIGPAVAYAAPVDVSYQLSGSAGNWVLDFSVTNNMPSTNSQLLVYLFGIQYINGGGVLSSPSNWSVYFSPVSTNVPNGSGKTYTTNWIDSNYSTAIGFGQTLSGFKFADGALDAPTSVDWVAYGIGPNGGDRNIVYTGPSSDYIGGANYNPGFEGTASAVNAVPIPAAAWLFSTAVAGLGFLRRKRGGLKAV
jgi:hypothetical protein